MRPQCIESNDRGIVVSSIHRWINKLGKKRWRSRDRCFGGVRRGKCPIPWGLFRLFQFGIASLYVIRYGWMMRQRD